jgi:glycosyltransferase involved in cell wall biosynthesis
MLDDLVDNLGLDNLHATVIHNPVDVGRIRQLAGQPLCDDGLWFENAKDSMVLRVVAAGRLVEEKGFDLLIEAVGLLNDDRIRLAILGDGPQRASLERLASDRGVKDRVRFVGFQANPFAWFARADVFVLSSRYEGFPNVVLEALACRTPVIATPAPGGTREILEQIPECRLAKAVSVQALADAIRQWGYVRRVPVPEEVVEPYRLSTVIGRYEALFGSS